MKRLHRSTPAALLLACSLFSASPSAQATTVYALTNGGNILTFDSATPGTITNTVAANPAIIGTYTLLAIDIRPTVQASPSNPGAGTLWAIGKNVANSFQLFVIDPATGATTAIGSPYAAGINGTPSVNSWGFDFNPSVDRIRLVDSAGDNYRLNPNVANGVVTNTDGNLAYQVGDTNFGTAPQVDGGAYTTAAFGGTTSLYYIDSNLNILVKAVDPNTGSLQTIGALNVSVDDPNGFDIFQSLALFSVPTVTGSALYSVNLDTGAATFVGDFPVATNVRGIAISTAVPVPPLPGPPTLKVNGKDKRTIHGSFALVKGTATDESGVVALSYRVSNRTSSFTGAPYSQPFSIKVRRLAFGTNRVVIRATDPDGHKTDKTLTIVRRH